MMRLVVVALAALAGGKIWTQDQIFRSAATDALIHAYRAKAIEACRKAPVPQGTAAPTEAAQKLLASAFAAPAALRLEIGNPDVDVALWQVDHAAWPMRYKYPYLVLEAGSPAPVARCSYDVTLDRAAIRTL